MAKLNPKDPQFGIPVATRIREELAFRFNKEAITGNKTLSRYVAEFIERAILQEKQLKDVQVELAKAKEIAATNETHCKGLQAQLIKEREIIKKTVGRFILEITEGSKTKATQLIETYNTILKDEKRNN